MASDLLALLDTLDGLHGAATSAECWTGSWDSRPYARGGFPWATFAIGPQHGIPADPTTSDADRDAYDRGADARNADVAWVRAIVRDYPRLAQALRTALNLLATERTKAADAARERAAIVAFLRDGIVQMAAEHYGNELQARSLRTLAQFYSVAADAIERGAHTKVTP